jgi:CYTH domain-containing protein
MALEIERKFLVEKAAWASEMKPAGDFYHQAYLSTDPEKTIRVRLTSNEAFLTIKGKAAGATRQEFEYQIPQTDARELLANFTEAGLIKTRYKLMHEGKLWEVDEFAGENEGLIVAEIELAAEDEEFALPAWVAEEVTTQEKYYNSNLSVNPFKNW